MQYTKSYQQTPQPTFQDHWYGCKWPKRMSRPRNFGQKSHSFPFFSPQYSMLGNFCEFHHNQDTKTCLWTPQSLFQDHWYCCKWPKHMLRPRNYGQNSHSFAFLSPNTPCQAISVSFTTTTALKPVFGHLNQYSRTTGIAANGRNVCRDCVILDKNASLLHFFHPILQVRQFL